MKNILISKETVTERLVSGSTQVWFIVLLTGVVAVENGGEDSVRVSFQTYIIPKDDLPQLTLETLINQSALNLELRNGYEEGVLQLDNLQLPIAFDSKKNVKEIQSTLNKFYFEKYFQDNLVWGISQWERLNIE